jgi:hypothetical protein
MLINLGVHEKICSLKLDSKFYELLETVITHFYFHVN